MDGAGMAGAMAGCPREECAAVRPAGSVRASAGSVRASAGSVRASVESVRNRHRFSLFA